MRVEAEISELLVEWPAEAHHHAAIGFGDHVHRRRRESTVPKQSPLLVLDDVAGDGELAFLMALLFYGGVMNLIWIVGLAAFVLVEKVMRTGETVGRVIGVALIGWGVWLGASALSHLPSEPIDVSCRPSVVVVTSASLCR